MKQGQETNQIWTQEVGTHDTHNRTLTHGVCHLFGAVWKQRGFKKSDGTPIQHAEQIGQLISAMMLPKRLAIIKCQAHKKRKLLCH